MKRIWFSTLLLATVIVAVSCGELEPTPEFRKSDVQFTASPSLSTVAVSAADSLAEVVSITWSDPAYAVGLSNSKFRVMVGAADQNFTSFQYKDYAGVLSGAMLGKEVNAIALKLGGLIGQPITLDVKVIASQENNNETRESAVFQVTVTPYGDLTLTPSVNSVVCSVLTPDLVGVSFSWSTAFVGYNGVKTYELQYSKGGTSFASYTAISMTSFSRSFTQLQLNNMALGYGTAPLAAGPIDFRIKATNETGAAMYSNTSTVNVTPYVAYRSIALVGDATVGGWDGIDTDMYRPDATKPTEWTAIVYLIGGKNAKFREGDNWDDNWGGTAFPSGIAGKNGFDSTPISQSGYYKVDFNAATAAYSFTLLTTPEYSTIGIIGSATANGWNDPDTDLTQDPNDPHLWTGTITLTDGFVKFRANDAWSVSWGGTTFPSGHAAPNPDIAVTAGTYVVRFNDATGDYQFMPAITAQPVNALGIIGTATDNDWGGPDTDLLQNPTNPFLWSAVVTLTAEEAKFRSNDDWAVAWGGSAFPSGVSTSVNGPNIPVATAGTYFITFNTGTGEYSFVR